MRESAELIGFAALLFVSTNIDDIFALVSFFIDPRLKTSQIVIGQYLGIMALTAISAAASAVSLVLAPAYVGLLGIFPVLLGGKKLVDLWRQAADSEEARSVPAGSGLAAVLSVTGVTMANGGDNIGVYTPVFASRSGLELAEIAVVFAAMTALWLGVGHVVVNTPTLGGPIRRYGHRLVPFVLIGIGLMVLHDAGSFQLLKKPFAAVMGRPAPSAASLAPPAPT